MKEVNLIIKRLAEEIEEQLVQHFEHSLEKERQRIKKKLVDLSDNNQPDIFIKLEDWKKFWEER